MKEPYDVLGDTSMSAVATTTSICTLIQCGTWVRVEFNRRSAFLLRTENELRVLLQRLGLPDNQITWHIAALHARETTEFSCGAIAA